MLPRRTAILAGLLATLLAVAFSIEAWNFTWLADFFLRRPPVSDGKLYFAMGRAWLNGLSFYQDLFETKPPGVFVLAGWSMQLGGGYSLYVWCQLVLLALLVPALGLCTYMSLDRSLGRARLPVIGLSMLLGLTVSVDALSRTLGYQAEGFGLLFATLPGLAFALPLSPRWRIGVDVLAGISLGLAAMFKEPLAASGLLALMVFCNSWRDLYRVLRITIIGGITSIAILVLSNSFAAYFALYLPEIFGGRQAEAVMYPHFGLRRFILIPTPLWVRSLNAFSIFTVLGSPISRAFFPLFFAGSLCLLAPLRGNDLRLRSIFVSSAIVAALLLAGHEFFILHQLVSGLHAIGKQIPWSHLIILRLIGFIVGPPAVLLIVLAMMPRRLRPSWEIYGFAVLAVVLMVAATLLVSYGGLVDPKYQVFAFPPLLAVGIYSITRLANRSHFVLLGTLGSLLITNSGLPSHLDFYFGKLVTHQRLDRPQQQAAIPFDALLTACNESRYFMANTRLTTLAGATVHSPYQMAYGIQRSLGAFDVTAASAAPNPYLAAKFKQDLLRTRIIVAAEDDILPDAEHLPSRATRYLKGYSGSILTMDAQPNAPTTSQIPLPIAEVIRDEFTAVPPRCAQDHVPIRGLQIFFRRR